MHGSRRQSVHSTSANTAVASAPMMAGRQLVFGPIRGHIFDEIEQQRNSYSLAGPTYLTVRSKLYSLYNLAGMLNTTGSLRFSVMCPPSTLLTADCVLICTHNTRIFPLEN